MRILVTGGLGAVGRPLVEALRERGHEVWVVDLPHNDDDHYLRADIGDFRELAIAVNHAEPDLVYHAAAEFGRKNGEDFYSRMWRTNAVGTKNVLRLQERLRFRMVFFSSSEVYGDWPERMYEDVLVNHPIRQLNDYAISKWVGEQQVLNSAARFGTKTVRVRLFCVYGPGEYYSPYRSLCCLVCYRALRDLPYTIYTGHKRSFTYIDDAVRTLATIADPGKFKAGEVYNIGGGTCHDVKRVSDDVLAIVGKDDSQVTYEEIEEHNTLVKLVDTTKAQVDLGHKHTVGLREGLHRTINWMRKEYGL